VLLEDQPSLRSHHQQYASVKRTTIAFAAFGAATTTLQQNVWCNSSSSTTCYSRNSSCHAYTKCSLLEPIALVIFACQNRVLVFSATSDSFGCAAVAARSAADCAATLGTTGSVGALQGSITPVSIIHHCSSSINGCAAVARRWPSRQQQQQQHQQQHPSPCKGAFDSLGRV